MSSNWEGERGQGAREAEDHEIAAAEPVDEESTDEASRERQDAKKELILGRLADELLAVDLDYTGDDRGREQAIGKDCYVIY